MGFCQLSAARGTKLEVPKRQYRQFLLSGDRRFPTLQSRNRITVESVCLTSFLEMRDAASSCASDCATWRRGDGLAGLTREHKVWRRYLDAVGDGAPGQIAERLELPGPTVARP